MKIVEKMRAVLIRNGVPPPPPRLPDVPFEPKGARAACKEAAHQICNTANEQATITINKARNLSKQMDRFLGAQQ